MRKVNRFEVGIRTPRRSIKVLVAAVVMLVMEALSAFGQQSMVDPFKGQLDGYWQARQFDEFWLASSASTAALGATGASTFQTMNSLALMDPGTAQIGVIVSYIITALAAGSTIWAAIEYNQATDAYMRTLQRETQYYNLLPSVGQ